MALTERALQVVQVPLRLVQQAAGGNDQDLRSELEGRLRPLRNKLEDLDRRLTDIEDRLEDIYDDTQHLRTQKAAERAEGEG